MSGARRAGAAAVCAIFLVLTACPSDSPDPQRSDATSPEATVAPAGEIRVAYPWEPPTLNPFLTVAPATRELVRPLLPALFRTMPGGEAEPWLVDRVLEESAQRVRFRLRSDAVWSNGTPITAADLRFTWQTIINPKLPIQSRAGYDAITDIVAGQGSEVEIRFSRDPGAWRELFGDGVGVLPEHHLAGKNFANELKTEWPVSGGPFVLSRYTRGLEMVLDASPHPWRLRPRAQRIRILFVPDSTTALQLYRAGRVDVLGPYSAPDFRTRLQRIQDALVSSDDGETTAALLLNPKASILSDERVRTALVAAADGATLEAGLVRGEGDREGIDEGPLPDEAPRLLDQAGFTGRRGTVRRKGSTELSVSVGLVGTDDLVARVARAMYERLRDAGFDVNLVALEYEQLWRDWLGSSRHQAAVVRFTDEAEIAGLGSVAPLWRVTVPAAARRSVTGVRANASADGFLTTAEEWTPAA